MKNVHIISHGTTRIGAFILLNNFIINFKSKCERV